MAKYGFDKSKFLTEANQIFLPELFSGKITSVNQCPNISFTLNTAITGEK